MRVLVAGATGGVGKEVVERLAAAGTPTVALVRDTTKGQSLPGVSSGTTEVRKGDVYQFSTLPGPMTGCEALVICTGARGALDPLGPFSVDFQGTLNLIAAAKQKGVKRIVFVTSIGTDDLVNPLNLFWGVLFWKKRAEEALQRSGIIYTIVRPGGLKTTLRQGQSQGNIQMGGAGTWGVPPGKKSGSILRKQVAEVCVAALTEPDAENKVVEIVADTEAPATSIKDLFASVMVW